MTEPITRAIPTPAVLAQPLFDRARWEDDVFSSELPANARLIALALAYCAAPSGHLPAGGPQNANRLAERTRLSVKNARISLHVLEAEGFLDRPSLDTWQPKTLARPVTLVFPPQATRTEPGHPSEAEG